MSSKLKSQTARTNGAKSRGPVTPEGLATSSQNSIRHGLTAINSVVLHGESKEEFQNLLDAYIEQFQPATSIEMETVEIMVIARWRLRRMHTIETNLFSIEMVSRDQDIAEEFSEIGDDDRLAWIFKNLADNGKSLPLMIRYEGTLNRSYDRAFKQLQVLQAARQHLKPNEPKPTAKPDTQTHDSPAPIAPRETKSPLTKTHPDSADEPDPTEATM